MPTVPSESFPTHFDFFSFFFLPQIAEVFSEITLKNCKLALTLSVSCESKEAYCHHPATKPPQW